MAGGIRKSDDEFSSIAEINITPFVDVMLVLLIIFMVTAPLLESGIPINLPKTQSKSVGKKEDSVSVELTKDRLFFINSQPVEAGQLIPALRSLLKKKKDKEVFLRADGTLDYEFVAQTMAAIKAAGVHKIGLVTQPKGNEE